MFNSFILNDILGAVPKMDKQVRTEPLSLEQTRRNRVNPSKDLHEVALSQEGKLNFWNNLLVY